MRGNKTAGDEFGKDLNTNIKVINILCGYNAFENRIVTYLKSFTTPFLHYSAWISS